jgi:carboxymethylenebutenolidase
MPIKKDPSRKNKTYYYPNVSPLFVLPGHPSFHASSASVSHTRTLSFLKPLLDGPYFDLEEIWEEHCLYEFGERAVDKTMSTMVQEPYVNHIPTLTGGIGRAKLTNFYRDHFVFSNPKDTALELVSRTVGIDRVIDEFVFSFTQDREIDWL